MRNIALLVMMLRDRPAVSQRGDSFQQFTATLLLAVHDLKVVGGQLISKSERGFVDFHWEFFAKEGIFTAAALLAAPIVAYYVVSRFIPIFDEPEGKQETG